MAVLIENDSANVDKILGKIPVELRQNILVKALKARGKIVIAEARRRVKAESLGDPRHHPEKKPLWKTIGQVVRRKGGRVTLVVGAQYPAGAHAHLVESGHMMVTKNLETTGAMVPGKPFMAPAVDTTQKAQDRAFFAVLETELERVSRYG